jgi:hypothetical protein
MSSEMPSLQIVQPTEVDGYLIVARDLLQGVEALADLPAVPSRAAALIAAHAVECALKAFLCSKGRQQEVRATAVQHDLIRLWRLAHDEHDLGIAQTPPDWVTILSAGHGPNFYFRYQEGQAKTIVHGGQTPALGPMVVELRKLTERVEAVVVRPR